MRWSAAVIDVEILGAKNHFGIDFPAPARQALLNKLDAFLTRPIQQRRVTESLGTTAPMDLARGIETVMKYAVFKSKETGRNSVTPFDVKASIEANRCTWPFC